VSETFTLPHWWELKTHPLAELFPEMPVEDYGALCRSIARDGLHEAIWLTRDDEILDGRHRFHACQDTDTEPTFRRYEGEEDEGALLAFVLALNMERRHLDASQRAMIAASIANRGEGRPGKTPSIEGVSQSEAAALLNVGVATVERAAKVQAAGAPEVIAAVKKGEMAVSAAAELVELPKEEQAGTLAALQETGKGKVTAARAREAAKARAKPAKREEAEAGLAEARQELLGVLAAVLAQKQQEEAGRIEVLDFSVRTYNCLKSADIHTIADLEATTEEELMDIRNFGRKSRLEVQDKLQARGLALAPDGAGGTAFADYLWSAHGSAFCRAVWNRLLL
jgi:ParB-like chromosome segregation protein Spo0J